MRWTLEWACSWRVSTYRRGRWTGQNRGAVTVERKEDDLGTSRTLLLWFALSSQDRWPQWRVAYRCISCGRGRTCRNNLAASCAYRHILKNQEGYPPKAMVWDPVEENYLESSSKNARLASTETPIFQVQQPPRSRSWCPVRFVVGSPCLRVPCVSWTLVVYSDSPWHPNENRWRGLGDVDKYTSVNFFSVTQKSKHTPFAIFELPIIHVVCPLKFMYRHCFS